MKVSLTIQQVGAWLLRLAALAGVVVSAVNPANLPTQYRTAFLVVSGVILAVDRYLSDPSTGTPSSSPAVSEADVLTYIRGLGARGLADFASELAELGTHLTTEAGKIAAPAAAKAPPVASGAPPA